MLKNENNDNRCPFPYYDNRVAKQPTHTIKTELFYAFISIIFVASTLSPSFAFDSNLLNKGISYYHIEKAKKYNLDYLDGFAPSDLGFAE